MRSFWIDGPPCERCGEPMHLTRRAPHPNGDERAEMRTFECPRCNHQIKVESRYEGPPIPIVLPGKQ